MAFDWTNKTDELRTLFIDRGLSAEEIASQLGGGLTRSAVLGKLNRLGIKRGVRPASEEPARPALPVTMAPGEPFYGPAGVVEALQSLLPGGCRAPAADPDAEDFAYCGAPASQGDYCDVHAELFTSTRRSDGRVTKNR